MKYFSRPLFFYFTATFLKIYLVILSFLSIFMVMVQAPKLISLITASSQQGHNPLVLVLSFLLIGLPLTFPLASLFSAMFYFHKLQEEGYDVAIRSIGLSEKFLILPVLLCVSVFSFWLYQVNQQLVPGTQGELRLMVNDVKAKSFLGEIKPGIFNNTLEGITFFTQKMDPTTFEMQDVFLKINRDGDHTKSIMSREGEFVLNEDTSQTVGKLVLGQGQMIIWNPKENVFEKFRFDKYEYPLPMSGDIMNVSTKASFLNEQELGNLVKEAPDLLKKQLINTEGYQQVYIEYYDRFSLPIIVLLFALLGSVIGGVFTPRSQKSSKTLWAILSVVLYYGTYFTFVGLSKKQTLAPIMASFLPSLILAVLIGLRFRKLKWAQ